MIKHIICCLSIIIALLSCAYASQNSGCSHGKLVLDQSQGIYFEKFYPFTYTLQLLNAKEKFDSQAMVIGGVAEADLQHWQGNNILLTSLGNYQTGNGLYLTQATLDAMASMGKWGTAFFSASEVQVGPGGSSGNYFYLPHAFIAIGNVESFPVYMILGINSIPFGVFSGTGTWDTPLTSAYFNPLLGPQVNVAFYKNNVNLNALVYRDEINYEYHFVSSVSYNNAIRDFTFSLGAGYLTNLKTNSTGNIATINNRKSESLPESIGNVVDANASVGYKLIAMSGEYLTGNDKLIGASNKPSAYSLMLSFSPTLLEKVTTFGVNRSVSLAFNNIPATLPGQGNIALAASGLKNSWAMSVSRPVYKDAIILGLDVMRVLTYDNLHSFAYTLDLMAYI